jgi:predicted metal-dependent hydrolase
MKQSQTTDIDGIGPVLLEHSSRTRRIIISVRPQKGVRVAVPGGISFDSALAFAHSKKQWIQKQLDKLAEYKNKNQTLAKSFEGINREEAKRKLIARLKQLAEEHGFNSNRVFIRNQQTRWGSCSHQNNISLNVKLSVLPEELINYVILHELVHTRVHDHSKRFWSELDKYVGNGKQMAAKLRNYDTRWI